MKEFDKWENGDCVVSQCDGLESSCADCKSLKKEGWKAALKRILQEEFNYEREVEIFDWIRKELEE